MQLQTMNAACWLKSLTYTAVLLVAGCGGGGGGTDNGAESPVNLTFAPGTIAAKQLLGASGPIQIVATVDRDISGVINVGVIFDQAGVFDPTSLTIMQSGRTANVRLNTLSMAEVGVHAGSIEVRLCRDNPQTCASPIPGSPWKLPYQVTAVKPVVEVSSATMNCYAGECQLLPIPVTIKNPEIGSFVTSFYFVGGQDPSGFININGCRTEFLSVNVVGNCSMLTAVNAPVGTYSGVMNLKFASPTTAIDAMDVTVPYSVTVRSASNLTPLTRISGAPEWTQEQGNAQHSGYVPITLDPSKFMRRWRWERTFGAPSGNFVFNVVTDSNRVFYADQTLSSVGRNSSTAIALQEENGQQSEVGYDVTSNLATNNGHLIFTGTVPPYYVRSLNIVNSADGGAVFNYPLPSPGGQAASNGSITVVDNKIYAEVGVFSAVNGASVSSGMPATFQPLAMTNSFAYGFRPTEFIGVPTNGIGSFSLSDQGITGWDMPILGMQNNAIAFISPNVAPSGDGTFSNVNGYLRSYNLTSKAISWDVPVVGQNVYTPAVANGVVYIVNGNSLEARSELTGALLWNWKPSGDSFPHIRSNIVAANNLIFIGLANKVYAIDASSHQTVWSESMSSIGEDYVSGSSYTMASNLAISPNGVLYAATRRGIIAYNLK